MKDRERIQLDVEDLEERIAPSATGNPGNNNPPHNNTNNPGNEGTGGAVSIAITFVPHQVARVTVSVRRAYRAQPPPHPEQGRCSLRRPCSSETAPERFATIEQALPLLLQRCVILSPVMEHFPYWVPHPLSMVSVTGLS